MARVADLTKEQAELRDAIKDFKAKDRKFLLISEGTPVTWSLPNRHTALNPLLWYDPIKESQREIRYCTNQASIFVDEQKGTSIIGDIILYDGVLSVKKEQTALQKLLLFYHPLRDIVYQEFDPERKAIKELSAMQDVIRASSAILDMDIVDLEAIARVVLGPSVDTMKSSSVRRDMCEWVKGTGNVKEFNILADNKDIKLRNLAQRAIDYGIIALRDSGTTVYFTDNDEVIVKVPFGENAIHVLTSFLQTDKGIKVMDKIALKLSK